MDYALMAALLGLAGGLVLGLAARLGEFCTFGAIETLIWAMTNAAYGFGALARFCGGDLRAMVVVIVAGSILRIRQLLAGFAPD